MQNLKKAFRLFSLAALIILASIGIGLSGGVAMPIVRRREDNPFTIELVESKEEQSTADAEDEEK